MHYFQVFTFLMFLPVYNAYEVLCVCVCVCVCVKVTSICLACKLKVSVKVAVVLFSLMRNFASDIEEQTSN